MTRKEAYAEIMERLGLSAAAMQDEFDEMPQSRSYLLLARNGDIAGTVRASVYAPQFGWGTLPLSKYHPPEMARLASRQIPAVQSSILGVVPQYRKLRRFPTLALMGAIIGTALAFGIDHLVTLVHPRPTKRKYWERIGWRAVGGPVPHHYSGDGALLLTASVRESLRIAGQSNEFRVLADIPARISMSSRFPAEI